MEIVRASQGGGGVAFSDSAGLRALLSDPTGTGSAVFANSPTLVTPVLGVASFTKLAGSGATVVASTPLLDLSQTWDNSGVTFTGIKLNVTNTASASGSLLQDWQVGGSSIASIDVSGVISAGLGSAASPSFSFVGDPDLGIYRSASNALSFSVGNAHRYRFTGTQFQVGSAIAIGWSSLTSPGTADTILARDAANTLAQRNSTNAQTFNLYNTYTDASNYERGFLRWSNNVLELGTEKAGTGSLRRLRILTPTSGTAITIFDTVADGTGQIYVGRTDNTSTANSNNVTLLGGSTATSGTHYGYRLLGGASPSSTSTMVFVPLYIAPTVNYSNATPGAGSYEALKIAVTETALPTGQSWLIRASAGAAGTTDKFGVHDTGALIHEHYHEMSEMTAPASPAANKVRIYAEDNGSGKTRLMALFPSGAAQQIAIEP